MQSGAGGYVFNGAGSLTLMFLPQFSVNVVRFWTGVATDFFVGGGWCVRRGDWVCCCRMDRATFACRSWNLGLLSDLHTHTHYAPHDRANNINNTRISYQVANSFFGFGNQAFVGMGGAAFIRSYSVSTRVVTISRPTRFTYTVAGMGIPSSGTRGQNLVLTKGGATEFIWNKTDGTVTKISTPKPQKTRAPTNAPGTSKSGGRKRARILGACGWLAVIGWV
jgi:hypothetical protein